MCVPIPCCPSTFCPKSFSLTSISSLLRAGESWQERIALSSVAPIFPVALYPRYRVRCPESNLGAHLHWVWGWAQVPGDSLGLLTSSSPFSPLLPSWNCVLMPTPPYWCLWHGRADGCSQQGPSEPCSKLCSIILLIRGTGESKTA